MAHEKGEIEAGREQNIKKMIDVDLRLSDWSAELLKCRLKMYLKTSDKCTLIFKIWRYFICERIDRGKV